MTAPAPHPGRYPVQVLTGSERAISAIFGLLAISFGVVGLIFLVFPDGTVRALNTVGAVFRIFPPAPRSELRFWLSLGVSYMALVTILAAAIWTDPHRYRHLMPILAAGKFCSSFTCLLYFIFSSPTFIYFLNFLVDGSIAALVLGCYAWTGMLEPGAARERVPERARPILVALLDTLVPETDAIPGARGTPLAQDVWKYFCQLHPAGPVGLLLLLQALEYGPYIFGPKRTRFSRLAPADQEHYLAQFERSRWGLRRQILASLKLIVMLHFYSYPEAQQATGYDAGYLRAKLLAGPNASHHRVRLQ